jgi:hypothetical protein
MARSIAEIYDEIVAEKQNMATLTALQPSIDDSQTLLNDLTTTSKVAIWRLWFWCVAFAIYTHESLFDTFSAQIETRSNEIIAGTPLWYQTESLAFQYGDSLTWNGSQYVYSTINTANQIIKRCAVVDLGYQVRFKIAKLDGNGLPIPLTLAEKNAFISYLNQIKFVGTPTSVVSNNGDDLKLNLDIQYNAQILDLNGFELENPAVNPVLDAINSYIGNLPFNGVYNVMALVDVIQNANGVVDVRLNSSMAKYGALSYSNTSQNYTPDAGYLVYDSLNSVINYQTTTIV